MSNETCETCRFFVDEVKEPQGICRRYPPTVESLWDLLLRDLIDHHEYEDGETLEGIAEVEVNRLKRAKPFLATSEYPTVFCCSWCGEYQPKPKDDSE